MPSLIRASHGTKRRNLRGLLAGGIVLPSGMQVLPHDRRATYLSAYDSRKRYLNGLGDDSSGSDIIGSDLDSIFGSSTPTDFPGVPFALPTQPDLTIGPGDIVPNTAAPGSPAAAYQNVIASGGGVDAANLASFAALQASAVPSQSPADYVSPSAAISAGIPASTVAATWATPTGVNSFSSPAAAVAGLTPALGAATAAATVAKLWTGGGATLSTAPTVSSWLAGSSIVSGMTNQSVLMWGVILIVGFSLISVKKKRR